MELLQGRTLSEAMQDLGSTGVVDRAAWGTVVVQEILRALCDVHAEGVVHRDIKPSNVMLLHAPGTSPRIKLMDFGLAFIDSDRPRLTRTGWILGTQGYMAPEQAMGSTRVTPAADIYPCGMILAQLLQDTNGDLSIDTLDRRVGMAGLAELVRSFLASNPTDRPQDASAALEALQGVAKRTPSVLASERLRPIGEPKPVHVRLPSRSPRAIKLDTLLAEASDGDRIELPHQVYELTGPIAKEVTFASALEGQRPTILLEGRNGLKLERGKITFENCRLVASDAKHAVLVGGSAQLQLEDTQVRCNRGSGIGLLEDASLVAKHSRIVAEGDCVLADPGATVTIERSRLGTRRGRGVDLGEKGELDLEACTIRGGERGGVRARPGSYSLISDTEIRGRAGAMLFLEAAKARVFGGSMRGGTPTVWATRGSKLTAQRTEIRGSKGVGVRAVGADRIRLVHVEVGSCQRGALQAEDCRLIRLVYTSVLCNQGDAVSVSGCEEIDIRSCNLMDGDPTNLVVKDTKSLWVEGGTFQGWPRVAMQLHRVATTIVREVRIQNAHDHAFEVLDCQQVRIEHANCCQYDVPLPLVVLGGPSPRVLGPL